MFSPSDSIWLKSVVHIWRRDAKAGIRWNFIRHFHCNITNLTIPAVRWPQQSLRIRVAPACCICSSRPSGGLLKRWFISKQSRGKSILLLQNAELSQSWILFVWLLELLRPFSSIHTVNTCYTHSTFLLWKFIFYFLLLHMSWFLTLRFRFFICSL